MAYRQVQLLAVVAAVACLAPLASATTYMVGDANGWGPKFNQSGWGDGLKFVVGDSLTFIYPKGKHTVAQVGKDDFLACNFQGKLLAGPPLNTGIDTVTLNQTGKMWFICTVPGHCDGGMKLAINVQDAAAPAPSAAPVSYTVGGAVAAVAAAVAAAVLAF